jgi:hypothetical protein
MGGVRERWLPREEFSVKPTGPAFQLDMRTLIFGTLKRRLSNFYDAAACLAKGLGCMRI